MGAPNPATARLLFVEDERHIATAVQRGLEADGFAVDLAADGAAGLEMARRGNYAALILDVMLPGLSGTDICRLLRADNDQTPVLMLTARGADADVVQALGLGADDYLTKPFSYSVLLARVKALLRRGGGRQPTSEVVVGDLRLDPFARRAWRGDDEIELSPRALAVLEYLMQRPGRVVSKFDLISGVWDVAFDGDPNIVEVYISRIRRAIDTPYDRKSLQTVRGEGYRLDPERG